MDSFNPLDCWRSAALRVRVDVVLVSDPKVFSVPRRWTVGVKSFTTELVRELQ